MGVEETLKALKVIGLGEIYGLKRREEPPLRGGERDKRGLLEEHFRSFRDCTRCPLHKHRTQVVFGDGNPYSPVVFVGEAPGEEEDAQGKPFVGRAGRYLNRKIQEVFGLRREEVYITNVCKCRPPGNRKPTPAEISACFPYLKREIDIIEPKVICCLGATAGEGILGKKLSVTKVRGQTFPYPYNPKIRVFLTYHPAYILRNPRADGDFTEDLERLRELID